LPGNNIVLQTIIVDTKLFGIITTAQKQQKINHTAILASGKRLEPAGDEHSAGGLDFLATGSCVVYNNKIIIVQYTTKFIKIFMCSKLRYNCLKKSDRTN
jgi:hypothetical protein